MKSACGFATILIILAIVLLIPIAHLVNEQFLGIRYPWEPAPFYDGNNCPDEYGNVKIIFGDCPSPALSPTSKNNSSSNLSAKDLSSAEALAKDETTSWKTYTNTNGGYSFKYPESWVVSTDPYNLKHFKLDNSASAQYFDLYIAEGGNYQEQSYSLKSQQAFGYKKPEVVQINNNEVSIALTQGEPNLFYSVLLTDKSKYVWLVFIAEPNPVSQRMVLDQILSTFKFTK